MSFVWDSFYRFWSSLLQSLGWQTTKSASILLLGLDNAGKTTLLHRLSTQGQLRPFPPTDRPRQDSFQAGPIHFQAFDLGGHEAVRHLWEDYVNSQISAVVFLVDAADVERLEEAGYELDALLSGGAGSGGRNSSSLRNNGNHHGMASVDDNNNNNNNNDDDDDDDSDHVLAQLPVAILLNKCDLEQAAETDLILEKMDYAHLQKLHGADKLRVFRISVLQGTGYHDAFRWIGSNFL